MTLADFFPRLAMFATKHKSTTLVITDGNKDVMTGPFDQTQVLGALKSRENVIAIYTRDAFFTVRFVKDQFVEAWRSPNGQWIGDEFNIQGRNVFGNLPAVIQKKPAPVQYCNRKVDDHRDETNPLAPTETFVTRSQTEEAARTGNLAAAISK